MITVQHALIFVMMLFLLGFMGCACRKNILVLLMCLNVLTSSACLLFVILARYYLTASATTLAVIVLTLSALPILVGLSLWSLVVKRRETNNVNDLNVLQGKSL